MKKELTPKTEAPAATPEEKRAELETHFLNGYNSLKPFIEKGIVELSPETAKELMAVNRNHKRIKIERLADAANIIYKCLKDIRDTAKQLKEETKNKAVENSTKKPAPPKKPAKKVIEEVPDPHEGDFPPHIAKKMSAEKSHEKMLENKAKNALKEAVPTPEAPKEEAPKEEVSKEEVSKEEVSKQKKPAVKKADPPRQTSKPKPLAESPLFPLELKIIVRGQQVTLELQSHQFLTAEEIEKAIDNDENIFIACYWSKKLLKQYDYGFQYGVTKQTSFKHDLDIVQPLVFCETLPKLHAVSIYTEAMYAFYNTELEEVVEGERFSGGMQFQVYKAI